MKFREVQDLLDSCSKEHTELIQKLTVANKEIEKLEGARSVLRFDLVAVRRERDEFKRALKHTIQDCKRFQLGKAEAEERYERLKLKGDDCVPTYRTMKKDYIAAIAKIERLKIRLANCGYFAKWVLDHDMQNSVQRNLRNIVTEADINSQKEKTNGKS